MGASESTPTPNNAKEQSVVHIPTTGHTAQQYHAQIVKNFLDLDKKDIYETFGLEGYATIDDISALTRKKHSLLLKYHPDKNVNASPDEKERLTAFTAKINLAFEILQDPEKKRRHDHELRRALNEEAIFSQSSSWWKWLASAVLTAGGGALIIAGAVAFAAPITAVVVVGGAVLSAGICTGVKTYADPNCSLLEFVKVGAVGALAGAAGTGIACAAAPAILAASAGKAVALAAGAGATASGAGHIIKDTADYFIADNIPGITDCRTSDEILSWSNMGQLAVSCAIGAIAGGATQVVANTLAPTASRLVDSAFDATATTTNNVSNQGAQAMTKLTDTFIKEGKQVVEKTLPRLIGENLAKNAAGAGAGLGGHAVVDTSKRVISNYNAGKPIGDALLSGVLSTAEQLPAVLAGVVIGTAIGTTCSALEQSANIKSGEKQQALDDIERSRNFRLRADGKPFKSGDSIAERATDGTRADVHPEEHTNRHVTSAGLLRSKINQCKSHTTPTTVYHDEAAAEAATAALYEQVKLESQNIPLPNDRNNQKFTYKASNGKATTFNLDSKAGSSATYKNRSGQEITKPVGGYVATMEVEVNTGSTSCGLQVKYQANGKHEYTECTRAKGNFKVTIERPPMSTPNLPATTIQPNRNISMLTSYPVAPPAANLPPGSTTNTLPNGGILNAPNILFKPDVPLPLNESIHFHTTIRHPDCTDVNGTFYECNTTATSSDGPGGIDIISSQSNSDCKPKKSE